MGETPSELVKSLRRVEKHALMAGIEMNIADRVDAAFANLEKDANTMRDLLGEANDIIRCYEMAESDGEFAGQDEEVGMWNEKMTRFFDGHPEEPAFCDAAALRDALESTEELLEHFAKPGTMLGNAFFFHMKDNRAALSAPRRNCARFSTYADAAVAFINEERMAFDLAGPVPPEFVRWLFSTDSTEHKDGKEQS